MKRLLLILMVSLMFGLDQSECAGDLNDDGIKNILDVVILMDDILVGNDVCEEATLCDEEIEVELWGVCYNIEETTDLDLAYQSLTGEIPPEIGRLTNLYQLNLHSNQLTGEIPIEIGDLANLTSLRLHSNTLTGEIPTEIVDLANLTYLHLSFNQLTGEIPTEIVDLANLTYLDLGANQLTGEIPPEIGNLINLTFLHLGANQLTGEIPPEIGSLTSLTDLWLYNNQLSGEIPSEIGNLINIGNLFLKINQLTGEIPQEVCNLIENNDINIENHILQGNNLINTCEEATSGSISGTITFYGAWPDDQVYISLNSFCCPLISTPDEFYTITSDQLINNQIIYEFENVIFGEYYIAVFRQTNWETIGAYPNFESPEVIILDSENYYYDNLNFEVTY